MNFQRNQNYVPVSRKYTIGYILLLLIVMAVCVLSISANRRIQSDYKEMTEETVGLNQLYIDVETANTYLSFYFMTLRSESLQMFQIYSQDLNDQIEKLIQENQMWSRDETDLFEMVKTYLKQGKTLCDNLDFFVTRGLESGADNSALDEQFNDTQDVISYINQSFKEIYSQKLIWVDERQQIIQKSNRRFQIVQIILLIIAAAICIIYYRAVLDGISKSLAKLYEFVGRIKSNPYEDLTVEIWTNDEFGIFAETLNEMLDIIHQQFHQLEENLHVQERLKRVEIEKLQVSSKLQKSQMLLLQSRINPHFLFNTLNTIAATAAEEQAEKTERLMDITASYLRYNLEQITKTVTLQQEMENVHDYVYIQQCRFGDRFLFIFEQDKQCDCLLMPCMILQPLVENALQHGIHDMKEGGKCVIRSRYANSRICLEVEDNGIGFSKEMLEKYNKEITDSIDEEHIGLRNVFRRINLFFGEAADCQIDSMPGKTVIRLILPGSSLKISAGS